VRRFEALYQESNVIASLVRVALKVLRIQSQMEDEQYTPSFMNEPAPPPPPITIDEQYTPSFINEPAPPPPPITIDDLLQSIEVVQQKESVDKSVLDNIGSISSSDLKTKLIAWAVAGFPNVYEIYQVTIVPPETCSDGVQRSLSDYIFFCSGKTIHEHVAVLQEKVTNITVSFANMGTHISIVVSKV
jgi:hypothetical protein